MVGEPEISRKRNLEVLNRKLIKSAFVQTLHPQGDHRNDLLPFRTQSGEEFSRQILFQQDFHAGCSAF